jgi:hypothetical protein
LFLRNCEYIPDSMQCPKCGKESNNLRVCPYCHEKYPEAEQARPAPRATFGVAQPVAGRSTSPGMAAIPDKPGPGFKANLRTAFTRQPPAVRWSAAAILIAYVGWYVLVGHERSIPANVVLPNVFVAPMAPDQAAAIMRQFASTAQITDAAGGVAVQFPDATFPLKREGQLALAQQYARADEIVQGHKRTIEFRDPGGQTFARADAAKGVMMVR